jgi:hypothetical protein
MAPVASSGASAGEIPGLPPYAIDSWIRERLKKDVLCQRRHARVGSMMAQRRIGRGPCPNGTRECSRRGSFRACEHGLARQLFCLGVSNNPLGQ